MSEVAIAVISAAASIAVAMIGIIPTLISNRKSTEKTLNAFRAEMSKEISSLRKDFDSYKKEDGDRWVKQLRVRILRFNDDLCNPGSPYPSEPTFEQAVDDCDSYHAYVEQRQKDGDGFHNGVGVAAMQHIVEEYNNCKVNSLFSRQKGN